MRLALLFHLAALHERATISLILRDILILLEVFLLDTQGHIARTRMQEVGRCGNCDGCTRAEEQARLRAAQEVARELEALKTEEASHLCTAESIHPACPLKKSNHEPLAWSIESADVLDQSNSPLFTLLPREIRDMIYNYALTDTTSYPVDRDRPENSNPFARFDRVSGYSQSRAGIDLYASDIATPLLYTCKAIYLETYATPLRINPYITGELSVQRQKRNLSTWQLAQIRSLDITLPQHGLENGALRNYLNEYWNATSRYQGRCYIVPSRVIRPSDRKRCENLEYANNNNSILVPVAGGGGSLTKKKKKRDYNHLVDVLDSISIIIPQDSIYPCAHTLKVALAQPIRHITLRLTHSDWWTWGNAPTDDNSTTRHLHLDPTFGSYPDGRPSNTNMRLRASERLRNRHPRLDPQSWGSHIKRALPGLETLDLVLETWKVKEEQLECVVQCAQTWRFCEEEGDGKEKEKWALVWDGEVVEKRWSRGLRGLRLPKDASWADRCNDFEVRVVRYVKKVVEG
jgi:hypothetical protein